MGEKLDAKMRNYYIDGDEDVANDYLRCHWLIDHDGYQFICLLPPHEGDVHKILDQYGVIRTRKVKEKPAWNRAFAA